MRGITLVAIILVSALPPSSAVAASSDEATAFVTGIIDKFNGGDSKAFLAAHEDNAVIVDEFGGHLWTGSGTAKRWLDDYMSMAKAEGVSEGRVDYGKAVRADSDGSTAYIVLPTTYSFIQKGVKMSEAGSMTFVVRHEGSLWKIASWTFSGEAPKPQK